VAAPLGAQDREHCAEHVEGAEHVGVEDCPRLRVGDFFDRAEQPVAGVVRDDVNAAEPGCRLVDGLPDGRLVAYVDVDGEKQVRPAQFRGQAAVYRGKALPTLRRPMPGGPAPCRCLRTHR
jgi:hypothetical protein